MDKDERSYEPPAIEVLGQLRELTAGDKKSATADQFNAQIPIGPGS
jgi:hypothetical protein